MRVAYANKKQRRRHVCGVECLCPKTQELEELGFAARVAGYLGVPLDKQRDDRTNDGRRGEAPSVVAGQRNKVARC